MIFANRGYREVFPRDSTGSSQRAMLAPLASAAAWLTLYADGWSYTRCVYGEQKPRFDRE
jgi:hypothetical protein